MVAEQPHFGTVRVGGGLKVRARLCRWHSGGECLPPGPRTCTTIVVQSKEKDGVGLCQQAARGASADQTGKQFASTSHQRPAASLLDWSEVPDGSSAKQRGRWRQPLSASSPCECQPDRQTVCASASHRRPAASLLLIGRRSPTAPLQSKEEGVGSLYQQAARASADHAGKQCLHLPRTGEQPQAFMCM